MVIHIVLVTTDDEGKRFDFHLGVCMVANAFERREVEGTDRATVNYAVEGEHFEAFLEHARTVGVTVEEIDGTGDEEVYRLLVGESGTGWAN